MPDQPQQQDQQQPRPRGLPEWFEEPFLVLDDAHVVKFSVRAGETEPCGFTIFHRSNKPNRATTGWCLGAIEWSSPTRAPEHLWQLITLDPLHVEPSLRCGCGSHGFVRNGRWESCPDDHATT